jgi:hypothetical protein
MMNDIDHPLERRARSAGPPAFSGSTEIGTVDGILRAKVGSIVSTGATECSFDASWYLFTPARRLMGEQTQRGAGGARHRLRREVHDTGIDQRRDLRLAESEFAQQRNAVGADRRCRRW